jgi:putative two-component system response regulator
VAVFVSSPIGPVASAESAGNPPRVLVIDDEEAIRGLICAVLAGAGYEPVEAQSSRSALATVARDNLSLVVSDIRMPDLSGIELLEAVHAVRPSLPVLLISGFGTYEELRAALDRGAHGFVSKPFSQTQLLAAVEDAIGRATRSEEDLRRRLITPTVATVLANAIEIRNVGMAGHCERLATLALRVGREVALPGRELEALQLGAILHDVGKIGVPDRVLLKAGPLNQEEERHMQTHPVVGEEILESLDFPWQVRAIVRHHHERWDGQGYPDGLAGEETPLLARIVGVSDAVEAMSARRLYRRPLDAPRIVEELSAGRGRQWDPELVDVVLRLVERGDVRIGEEGLEVFDSAPSAPQAAEEEALTVAGTQGNGASAE